MEKMKTKTKKIFSLSVLVLCIAVLGLVSAASANQYCAETRIEDVLDGKYGTNAWNEVLHTDDYKFNRGTWEATAIVVDTQCGYVNPTGYYIADTDEKYQLFSVPPVKGDTATISASNDFGLYIDSNNKAGPTFYSENSKNSDGEKHVRLFTCDGGYVLAFEDLTDWSGVCEPDYNDVVVELTGVNLIPEFTTIAIPVASILGLLFFFNHRKRRKN